MKHRFAASDEPFVQSERGSPRRRLRERALDRGGADVEAVEVDDSPQRADPVRDRLLVREPARFQRSPTRRVAPGDEEVEIPREPDLDDLVVLRRLVESSKPFVGGEETQGLSYTVFVSMFPALTAFAAQRDARFSLLTQKGFEVVLAAAVPLTVAMVLAARPLLDATAGSRYGAAAGVLQILAFYPLLAFANGLL
jgi:hypothetical protein